jgi:hypothetical protein
MGSLVGSRDGMPGWGEVKPGRGVNEATTEISPDEHSTPRKAVAWPRPTRARTCRQSWTRHRASRRRSRWRHTHCCWLHARSSSRAGATPPPRQAAANAGRAPARWRPTCVGPGPTGVRLSVRQVGTGAMRGDGLQRVLPNVTPHWTLAHPAAHTPALQGIFFSKKRTRAVPCPVGHPPGTARISGSARGSLRPAAAAAPLVLHVGQAVRAAQVDRLQGLGSFVWGGGGVGHAVHGGPGEAGRAYKIILGGEWVR